VTQTETHPRIIARVAKAALAPLGFQRKGASRIWLADHGYWLDVIEFQPSGFSKGTYCNVAVHWLWGLTPALTFDYGFHRVGSFVPFDDAETFSRSVEAMARAAAQSVERHRATFISLAATADHLAQGDPDGWGAFHAGIACGLVPKEQEARRLFHRADASDGRDIDWVHRRRAKIAQLMALLGDRAAFQAEVQAQLDAQRMLFKLVPGTLRL
jgi:hypothetical protein